MKPKSIPPSSEANIEQCAAVIHAALALEHQPGGARAAERALRPALRALERSPHPEALKVLRHAYELSLNPWGQSWAAHAIASLPDDGRWAFLQAELEAPVWRVRMICIQGLTNRADAAPLLLHALDDAHWRVRDAAARSLGRASRTEQALEALEAALNDADERVVATAERSLDRLRAATR